MSETRHVYPLNDLVEHDTESTDCWCDPRLEFINGHWLVVHNAADGREFRESVLH